MAPIPSTPRSPIPEKKALLICIQYKPSGPAKEVVPLRHVIDDLKRFKAHLINRRGYLEKNIKVMTEDQEEMAMRPTKANLEREFKTLVLDAKPGDTRLLWFAGHSVQVQDVNGDEPDGLDEGILALDHHGAPIDSEGHPLNPQSPSEETQMKLSSIILDDDLRQYLVTPLPSGARLVTIFDSCTSGSLLDLKHNWPHCDYVAPAPIEVELESPVQEIAPQLPSIGMAIQAENRRCTVFGVDPEEDDITRRFSMRPLRQCTVPVPKRRRSSMSDWRTLRGHRCADTDHAVEKSVGNVVSLSSAEDSKSFICPDGRSLTDFLIDMDEREEFNNFTWKQLLQRLTERLCCFRIYSLARHLKEKGRKMSKEQFEYIVDLYHPQLGSDAHSIFDEPVNF